MQIRQISAAERADAVFELATYAFSPSPWQEADREAYAGRATYFGTATALVAEEGGRALASVTALPMRQNVRGVVQEMAGIAGVVSHPETRRKGYVRQLLARLLEQSRDQGRTVSALYPFRPSFYARFGYVGIPRIRTAIFAPEGLAELQKTDLPGEVVRLSAEEAYEDFTALTHRLLGERHGFAVFDKVFDAWRRNDKSQWVALARAGDEVVGAVTYRVDQHGGELVTGDLLTTGPLGRALLLQFLARHIDQVARVKVRISRDEVPELWGTDLAVLTEGRTDFPLHGAPMVRLLSMNALNGLRVGADADITVEVTDDALLAGRYRITGDAGALHVEETKDSAQATLTCAGISALAYGVLNPVEVTIRGFGAIGGEAQETLAALFPKKMPYMFADF